MIGENIKQAREYHQWSQQQLASLANLSLTVISKLENGEKTNLSHEIVKTLSRVFEVSIDKLLGTNNSCIETAVTPMITVKCIPGKGRGTIAIHPILQGTIIETAPSGSFPAAQRKIVDKTDIFKYYFVRPSEYQHDKYFGGFIVFGLSSLCNSNYG